MPGTFATARRQCQRIGWPATSKSGFAVVVSAQIGFLQWTLLTLGTSKESGLNLVPLEGPPTWEMALVEALCFAGGAYENDSFGRVLDPILLTVRHLEHD